MPGRVILFLLLLYHASLCQGQFNRGSSNPSRNSDKVEKDTSKVALPDTTIYRYHRIADRHSFENYGDSSLDGFQIFEPNSKFGHEHLTLGNLGGSTTPISYSPVKRLGTNLGYNQYALYQINQSNFKFFENNRPLNDLFFSPLGGEKNFMTRALFARPFSNDVNLTLDYTRLNQEGFYRNQETKATHLGFGISYKKKRYQILANLFVNNNNEEFHGGINITDPSELATNSTYTIRTNVPVKTSDASGRHEHTAYVINQYLDLLKKDSSEWELSLHHEIDYKIGSYRFSDKTTSSNEDSISYLEFRVEDRGIRAYSGFRRMENSFNLQLHKKKDLYISLGLRHAYDRLDQVVRKKKIHGLFLESDIKSNLGKVVQLQADAKVGIAGYVGDFDINGRIDFSFGKWFDLYGKVAFYRYSPSITDQEFWVSEIQIWENDFISPFGTSLSGGFRIPRTNTNFSFSQTIERNSIYRIADTFLPLQFDGTFSATKLAMEQEISLGGLHYRGHIMYQIFSDPLYVLPWLTTTQSLFFESRIFKKRLLFQVGADHRFMIADGRLRFSPTNGQFYPASQERQYYNRIDAFVNLKISKLKVFVKLENAVDVFQQQTNFLIQDYPEFDFKVRLGLRWILKD